MIFYLHGFASSPKSTKADFFRERLSAHDVPLRCPDFNVPEFRTLTMSRMLNQLRQEIDESGGGPATLIGSSLGGTLAILAAAHMPDRVQQLVLLAPAVMFAKPGHHLLPPERIDEWRNRGALPFFHYGFSEEQPLDYAFYQDSTSYDAFNAAFDQPTLIFQGQHDASVDSRTVEAFAASRTHVALALLDDDHQLHTSLPRIWTDVEPFLGLID